MFYAILGLIDPGDEVDRPGPRLPDLRVAGPLRRRHAGAHPDPDGERLPARRRRARVARSRREDADDRDQLPGEPDRRRPDPRRHRARSPSSPQRHDLVVLADEIYGRILYDGAEHVSIASLPGMAERTIVLDGFSKTFAMTGWRLGYAIVPEWLVQTYGQLVINTISCAPTFAQVGAVEALRGPQDDVDAMVVEFRARRDLIVDGLNAIPGIRCLSPDRRVLRVPRHRGHGPDRRGARRAAPPGGRRLRARPGRRSGASGATTSGSRTRTPARTWARRCAGSGRSSTRCPASPAPRSPRARRGDPAAGLRLAADPRRGHRPDPRRSRTRPSGPTSCRRRATTLLEARRGLRRRPDAPHRPRRRRVPRRRRAAAQGRARTTPSASTTSTSRPAPGAGSRSATRPAS